MSQPIAEAGLVEEYRQFTETFDTLVLGTASGDGVPEASMAPFVFGPTPVLYVYLSDLATHAGNLRQTQVASVLFAECGGQPKDAFARRRLSFHCQATRVDRHTEEWRSTLDTFQSRFGGVMNLIRPLGDFNLYRLRPRSGNYVRGFAKAYRIDGETLDRMRQRDGSGDNRV